MGKIWFFGDCFTWGFGCHSAFKYCKNYKTPGDYIWTDIVAKELNRIKVDKSTPVKGTNFTSIKALTENLLKIKSEDIVVYGTSKPLGLLKLNHDKTSIESLATYNIGWDRHWRDEEDKKVGLNYIETNVRGYDKVWMEYFTPQIKALASILLSRDIKTYIWSYELYDKADRFESIKEATAGEIDDYHFSFQGHRDMAEYIVSMIKNNQHFKMSLV